MYLRKLKQRVGRYLGVALVLLGVLTPLLADTIHPAQASADSGTLHWSHVDTYTCFAPSSKDSVNAVLLYQYKGKTYTFKCYQIKDLGPIGNNGDHVLQMFLLQSANDPCQALFQVGAIGTLDRTKSYNTGTLGMFNTNSGNGCLSYPSPDPVSIDNTYDDAAKNPPIGVAYWSPIDPLDPLGVLHASFTLGSFTNAKEVFTQTGIYGNLMQLTGTAVGAGCDKDQRDFIDVGAAGQYKNYWQDTVATLTTWVPGHDESGNVCIQISGLINLVDQKTGKPASYTDAGGTDPTQSVTTEKPCIFDISNINPINWVLCAVDSLAWEAATALNNSIQGALFVDPNQAFNATVQHTFDVFRNIALIILLLVGLVMVASQAAGLELFSAYSVRKVLPKIVFAAIGLSLAWPLLQFAVTFFNDIGFWVQSIILAAAAPFPGGDNVDFGAALISYAAGGYVLVGLGTAGLVSLALTTLLSLLVAFVVLVIRQIVIFICILLAPLAIALMVLPGTANLGKLWRTSLTSALATFPVMMAFLATGDAVGRIAYFQAKSSGNAGSIYYVIAIVAKYIPYLFLGTALGMVSKTLAATQQALNARIKPIQEGQAKRRQAIQAQNLANFRAGTRFGEGRAQTIATLGTNRIGNFAGRHLGAGVGTGFGFFPGRGRAAITNNQVMTADAYSKVDPTNFGANVQDANFLAAAAGFSRRQLQDMGMYDGASYAKAQLLPRNRQVQSAALNGLAKTGQFRGSWDDLETRVNAVGANAFARSTIKSDFQNTSKGVGRIDLGEDNVYQAIAGMKPEDLSNIKSAAVSNIFTPTAGRTEAPIAEMLRTGNYVSPDGTVTPLQEGQRIMLGRVLYEASAGNRVGGNAKQAVDTAYTTLLANPAARRYLDLGRDQSIQSKTGF